jgi:glycosyltransferase involved in cell wall biosynthesis
MTDQPSRFTSYRSPALQLPAGWQVPEFTVDEYAPRTTRHCVVIPVINEGTKFLRQVGAMAGADLGADIIIADGGSTDASMVNQELAMLGVRAKLVKAGPGGLSAQLRMAFAFALQQGYGGCVTIDGNGKDGWEAIPSFLAALDEGYGFVQGSRYVPGGEAINTPLDRHLAVRCLHAPLISLAAGFRYTDTTNGFRAFSAGFLSDPRVAAFRDVFDTYNLHYYLAVRAPRTGYRVCEVPVRRAYPEKGKTPTKISGLRGRLRILRQLWTSVTGGYNPPGAK